jgi:hypothetical protein
MHGVWSVDWLSGAVAQADQDDADDDSHDAQADPDLLQRAEPTPLAGAGEVHSDDAGDCEQGEYDDENAELALGNHTDAL